MKSLNELEKIEKLTFSIWLFFAILNWALIVLAMHLALNFNHLAGYFLAIFFIGTRQHAIAGLGHEGAHGLVASKKKINDLFTCLFTFWPLVMTLSGYKKFHFQHHRHLGSEKDPELQHKAWSQSEWSLPVKKTFWMRQLLKDLCGLSALEMVKLIKLTLPERKSNLFFLLCCNFSAQLLLLYFGFWPYLLLWHISILTSFWAMFRLRIWIEHMGTNETHRVHIPLLSRIVFAPVGYMYHWEHHHYMKVPFYRMSQIRKLDHSVPVKSLQELREFYYQCEELCPTSLVNHQNNKRKKYVSHRLTAVDLKAQGN
jgi:fatty acid desaturase